MGVFSELKPVNHARKNPFDLSCYSTYNTKVGMILPLQSWPTLPNSKYKLDIKALMRTQPLHTAAFAGFSINYDVVWSPYNDHYSSFNQFIAQRLNKQHTTQPDIREIPSFALGQFLLRLIPHAIYESLLSEIDDVTRVKLDNDNHVNIREYLFRSLNFPSECVSLGAIRTLDLLGYGNYLPLVKGYIAAIKKYFDLCQYGYDVTYQNRDELQAEADPNLPYAVKFAAWVNNMVYSFKVQGISFVDFDDHFDLSTLETRFWSDILPTLLQFGVHNVLGNGLSGKIYSLWSIMTYNKVWWQFYRNEYYDESFKFVLNDYPARVVSFEYVQLFNFDDFDSWDDDLDNDNSYFRILCMFAVKPHQYKKDLFTGLLPSTQYGSVSVATSQDSFAKLISNITTSHSVSLDTGQGFIPVGDTNAIYAARNSSSGSVLGDKFKFSPAPAIEVLELRRADALQRFRERMLRAGNRTKDIFKAHGWDEPLSEKAFEAEFLGTFDGRLDLNVVTSTTDTEKVNLGQLAANGIGVIGGNAITFDSHDFGTLMVVAYITKDAIYDAYGVDSVHTKLESFDFPYPELQNVSLSPINEGQLDVFVSNLNNVLGFLPQNMTYKTAVDKVHGEFFSVNPFAFYNVGSVYTNVVEPVGIFANMVTPRLDISRGKSLDFFYIQTDCADNIFVVNADPNQDTDQFFANVHFDLKAVQPLDVIGLPI